ncbi:MAG: hypothetical protein OXH05_04135 [Acidobacteria bacterium]|nr:hypothetical protein [Acidobacteriota bacterium]
MSLSDKIEQTRRDFAAMRQSAQDARATLDEIQEAGQKLRDAIHRVRPALLLLVFLVGFFFGVFTPRACSLFVGN